MINYPIVWDNPFPPGGTALPVTDGPDPGTEVSVMLTFWRPQRRALPEETAARAGKWIDMGGLGYVVRDLWDTGEPNPPPPLASPNLPPDCPQSSFSELDPNLSPTTMPNGEFTWKDSAGDETADPNNKFSFTLNLSQCFSAMGESFKPGDTALLGFLANLWTEGPVQADNGAASGYEFQSRP